MIVFIYKWLKKAVFCRGVQPAMGWVSERMDEGKGKVLLERLPRTEWSTSHHHETAIAERISALRNMHNIFTHHGTKNLKPVEETGGKLVIADHAHLPFEHAPRHVSKERDFVSAVLGGCGEDRATIEHLLTRCEKRHLFLSFPYVCPEPVLAK
jgi:hypothetical protein